MQVSWGDVATWLTVIAGFVAIIVGVWTAVYQTRKAAAAASWSSALAAYQTYLELGVQYPEYAAGDTPSLERGYAWYLTVLCYAAEQLLSPYCGPKEARQAWKQALGEQFNRHGHVLQVALAQSLPESIETFSAEVQDLIRAAAGSPRARGLALP